MTCQFKNFCHITFIDDLSFMTSCWPETTSVSPTIHHMIQIPWRHQYQISVADITWWKSLLQKNRELSYSMNRIWWNPKWKISINSLEFRSVEVPSYSVLTVASLDKLHFLLTDHDEFFWQIKFEIDWPKLGLLLLYNTTVLLLIIYFKVIYLND